MSDLKQLFFSIRGKPVSRWYDFEIHRFVKVPEEIWYCCIRYKTTGHGTPWNIDCSVTKVGSKRKTVAALKKLMARSCTPKIKRDWWMGDMLFGNFSIVCTEVDPDYFKGEEEVCVVCNVEG